MKKIINKALQFLLLSFSIFFIACISSNAPRNVFDYNEFELDLGRGAILMHTINYDNLVASRWFKVDNPTQQIEMTVFPSRSHKDSGNKQIYDLMMVEPGTYALFALFTDCPSGYRPYYLPENEGFIKGLSTPLGHTVWKQKWNHTRYHRRMGVSYGFYRSPIGFSANYPHYRNFGQADESACYLMSPGINQKQEILIASVTVKPGEVVYAGEINFNFFPNNNCYLNDRMWTSNTVTNRCGAARIELEVTDQFQEKAYWFLFNHIGEKATQKVITRLAKPGILVSPITNLN